MLDDATLQRIDLLERWVKHIVENMPELPELPPKQLSPSAQEIKALERRINELKNRVAEGQ